MKKKIASMVRIISVPPVIVIIQLVLLFYLSNETVFNNVKELLISILLLGIIPVAAYPMHLLIPKLRERGRQGQRELAFIFTIVGYLAAYMWSLSTDTTACLKRVISTFMLSVIILVILNKVINIKASGHACSMTSPIIFLSCFIKWYWVFPGMALWCIVAISSVWMERHNWKQLAIGTVTCLVATLIAFIIY